MFDKFLQTHGPSDSLKKPDGAVLKRFKSSLPDALLDLWQSSGFGSYGGGLLWLIDPQEMSDIAAEWVESEVEPIPFLRTAFGSFFYWRPFEDRPDVSFCNVFSYRSTPCVTNMEVFFNDFLTDKNIRTKVLKEDLFKQAAKKLGSLSEDEMFGFEPALPIGGAMELKHAKRFPWREHLDFLLQLDH